MKNFDFRRMCRVINAFGKVREGYGKKKMLKNDVRSRYVHENKQKDDTFTEIKSDIFTQPKGILHKITRNLLKSSVCCHYSSAGERTSRFKM